MSLKAVVDKCQVTVYTDRLSVQNRHEVAIPVLTKRDARLEKSYR